VERRTKLVHSPHGDGKEMNSSEVTRSDAILNIICLFFRGKYVLYVWCWIFSYFSSWRLSAGVRVGCKLKKKRNSFTHQKTRAVSRTNVIYTNAPDDEENHLHLPLPLPHSLLLFHGKRAPER
jgi:hypothetical protein